MKTQLLKMTPREFCAATSACSEDTRFAIEYKTMRSVWEHCQRVDWLCWILDELDVPADEKAVRLYMVWCARNTPMHDGRTTAALLTDQRSQDALAVAEQFANGQATQEELLAARSAARSVAWSVADSAARSVADSVADSAARSVAWSVAQSAAWSVAQSAAWSVARSAAWSAAQSAAWSAAQSAADSAAQSAAWSVARSAAWSAAQSAAQSAQADQFRTVVANPFA